MPTKLLTRTNINSISKRMRARQTFIWDPSLVLYVPLWDESDGASFISKDANAHVCTVTNAIWTPQGRTFNGIDDEIDCGSASTIDNIFDGGGTILAWINPVSSGEGTQGTIVAKISLVGSGFLFAFYGSSGNYITLSLYNLFSGHWGLWLTTTAVIPKNVWSMVGITYNSDSSTNDPILYLNEVSTPVTEVGTPSGTRLSDADLNLVIGGVGDGTFTFDGTIGEVLGHKGKILTAPEIQHNYQATKWRFR